jgi:hypothetical protein
MGIECPLIEKYGSSCTGPIDQPLSAKLPYSVICRPASKRTVFYRPLRPALHASVLSPKYEVLCCDQNGPPARREEGACLNRYVTDPPRRTAVGPFSSQPSGPELRLGGFFGVALSTRIRTIWVFVRAWKYPPRRNSRQSTSYFGDRTLGPTSQSECTVNPPAPVIADAIKKKALRCPHPPFTAPRIDDLLVNRR